MHDNGAHYGGNPSGYYDLSGYNANPPGYSGSPSGYNANPSGYYAGTRMPNRFSGEGNSQGMKVGSAWLGQGPKRRQKLCGTIGICLVVVAFFMSVMASIYFKDSIREVIEKANHREALPPSSKLVIQFIVAGIVLLIAGLMALAGFVLGILALFAFPKVRNVKDRNLGILAIVMFWCSPFILAAILKL
jgi:hypothetical protein